MFKALEIKEQNEVKGRNIEKRIGQFFRNVEFLENEKIEFSGKVMVSIL